MSTIREQIEKDIKENKVILYMKGDKNVPQCGFSGQVVHILNMYDIPYETRNILESDELRQAIKEYSDWPTLPQLFINGEFVGGCDVVTEMHHSGELKELLKK